MEGSYIDSLTAGRAGYKHPRKTRPSRKPRMERGLCQESEKLRKMGRSRWEQVKATYVGPPTVKAERVRREIVARAQSCDCEGQLALFEVELQESRLSQPRQYKAD